MAENDIIHLDESIEMQEGVKVLEIFYVLTESTDKTEEKMRKAGILTRKNVHFSKIPKSEFSHSLTRERASLSAKGDILVFLTQDVDIKDPHFFEKLCTPVAKGEADAAYARQNTKYNNIEKYTREHNYPEKSFTVSKADLPRKGLKTFFFSDAAGAVSRKVFENLKGYDGKNLPISEDMYLAYKIIMHGGKIEYVAEAEVYHSHNFSLKELYNRYKLTGQFMKLNPEIAKKGVNAAGGGMARYILKRAIQDKNLKVLARFLPDMTARYLGMWRGRHEKLATSGDRDKNNANTKILAINLPAFHRTKENDEWWGEGFTEWDNVKKGEPYFEGHQQPVHPIKNYYYDLSKTSDIKKQLQLAKEYDIYGFVYYHYWFGNGKKLLEKPLELLRDEIKTDTKYCLCWANETWKATWHGKEPKDLLKQEYPGKSDWKQHIDYLLTFFKDKRYIIIDDQPVLFIYKPNEIPGYERMLQFFDEEVQKAGFKGVYAVEYISAKNRDLFSGKSQAVTEFEPLYTTFFDLSPFALLKRFLCKKLKRIDYQNYDKLWQKIISRKRTYAGKPIFRGCFSGWDNSPRKGKDSMIVKGGNPETFERNLRKLIGTNRKDANDFIVINAWNEWSEGAFLEPSEEYGYAYLEAIRKVVNEQ